jgi:uncharacterized protein YbaR (Trm112 family)
MDSYKILSRIKQLYLQSGNIMQYLRELHGRECNSSEDIMISYDFQAGTYTARYKQSAAREKMYCTCLAKIIDQLGPFNSLLEAGVGEATTLGPLLMALKQRPADCYAFDISWSRVKYAKKFLQELDINDTTLFIGDLFNAPLMDHSIDIVYTSHSVEPNGGKEKEALTELYRITNKYLILLEPAYELAGEEARMRMRKHGYVTNLLSMAQELGYHIIEYRLFDVSLNPLNPTGIMIIQKKGSAVSPPTNPLCCPITRTNMVKDKNAYFSPESLLAYPIIDEIPCLLSQNAIIATKFLD